MEYEPKITKYATSDRDSFAYPTACERWPEILTTVIDSLHRSLSDLPSDSPKLPNGKAMVAALAKLKYEVQHDRALTPLPPPGRARDATHLAQIRAYNDELEQLARGAGGQVITWFTCPSWLYAECYLYQRVASVVDSTGGEEWRGYDVFARQKIDTFRSSRVAVLELAKRYTEIVTALGQRLGGDGADDGEHSRAGQSEQRLLFREICDACLWGNATDLSLLTNMSLDDIQNLQGAKARKDAEEKILVNDIDAAYDILTTASQAGRDDRTVEIVLDNAGFELYVDLVLAGYLIAAGLADRVVLHAKDIPWFVSDVTPADFGALLNALAAPDDFFKQAEGVQPSAVLSANDKQHLQFLFSDWARLHSEGQLTLRSNSCWTEAGSYWRLPHQAPDIIKDMWESELVIFKGDLNYRKLTGGDARFDATHPFSDSLGPLGAGSGINVLALRTCKSDPIVGLPAGRDEELRAQTQAEDDRGARKWAWGGKWAVMQLSSGKR